MNCNDAPILIFDEDNICRHAVADILERHDYFVVEASTGGQATAMLEGNPRLIMVGFNRSQSAAVSWMTKLREQGNRTPIVILSSCWCDAKTFYLFRNVLNVSLILQKPIAPNLLMNQLEFVLPARPAQGPASVNFHSPDSSSSCASEATGDSPSQAGVEPEDLSDFMAEIKREYAAQLPAVWTELLTCVECVKSEPMHESLPDAINFAHKLRGNAGAYGFPQLSAIAERIEHLLGLAACTDSDDRDGFWSLVVTALDEGTSFINAIADPRCTSGAISYSLNLPRILVVGNEQRLKAFSDLDFAEFTFVADGDAAITRATKATFAAAVIEIGDTCGQTGLLRVTKELRLSTGNESLPLGTICQGHSQDHADLAYAGISVSLQGPTLNKDEAEDLIRTLIVLRQSQKRKILVIDDDVASTNFISAQLTRAGHVVHCINEPIETFGVLGGFVPDLVLLDVFMPGLSGYDVARIMRSMPHVQSVPILFITARNDQAVRSAAFQAGANDFLCKPIVGDELLARIKCHLNAADLSNERMAKDPITHVPTLGSSINDMSDWLSTCRRNEVPMSLCLLKLDGWEERLLTDSPASAERILSALARLIQSRFKTEDMRARWGDAGFVIAFPAERKQTAAEALVLLRREFEQLQFIDRAGRSFSSSFSSATTDSSDGIETVPDLISACYTLLSKNSRAKERKLFCSKLESLKDSHSRKAVTAVCPPAGTSFGGTLLIPSGHSVQPRLLLPHQPNSRFAIQGCLEE